VDLDNYRHLILSVSLLITMILVVQAFEWKKYESTVVDLVTKKTDTFEVMIDVPTTDVPEPLPPVPVAAPIIVEVPDEEIQDEIKLDLDVEMTQETRVQEYVAPEQPKLEEEETDEVFVIVETPASPKGGMPAFYKDISSRIHYPAQARRMRIEGKVFVEFVVSKTGQLTEIKVVKGIGAGCDEEAVRIIQTADPWIPGRQRGKPVKQRMVLPITFKLVEA
jgi:protein TonB